MPWLIILAGLLVRSYFVFFKGLNSDQATSLGFIQNPWWQSVWWDNAPPTFYFFGKIIKVLAQSDMGLTTHAMQGLIFLLNGTSFVLLAFYLIRNIRGASLLYWLFALALFPVTLIDGTVIRPAVLIEFFAVLNFLAFKRILNGTTDFKTHALMGLSAIGICVSSYACLLYFIVLAFYFLYEKREIPNGRVSLSEIKAALKAGHYKFLILMFLIFAVLGGVLYTRIRWDHLIWFKNETSFRTSIWASVIWVRNLVGYNWIALLTIFFVSWRLKNWKLPVSFSFLFLFNLISSRAAVEPRFVIFLWPLIFVTMTELDLKFLKLNWIPRPWINGAKLLILFVWIWQTAWFLKEPRSTLSEAVEFAEQSAVQSVLIEMSPSALDYLFPTTPSLKWDDLKSVECPHRVSLIVPTHRPQYNRLETLNFATEYNFELVSETYFLNSKLESMSVSIFQKNCRSQ